ncbi:ribbon-helix-helix domain-containing protein [Synechococcus sp. CS-1328]|uniref:ribbon-helix-helix domain-containing protein n=1 Tax=Synechococcus sp. CS-1328 TaxID=2847976 RepID=UPI00223B2805|nr:hypothetical protein [Synechococcus sp. CS-1328]MCT0225497.1 hypothetical protein [Synechococcus sp. CS-1328]
MPTRQTSSSGRSKSPRIQVVLPEELCERLTALADQDSRTVSNMARVLIQQGVERIERQRLLADEAGLLPSEAQADRFRAALVRQEQNPGQRLQGNRRPRLYRPRG